MEDDVLDALEQIGYSGPLSDKESVKKALEGGPKSIEYTQLVEWLSKELKYVCNLEENVNAIGSSDDSSSFLLELSGFLKELGCPHKSLMEGTVNQRLMSIESRFLLIGYLCSELQSARIIAVETPETDRNIDIKVQESTTANDLKTAVIALGFSKPPHDVTVEKLFAKMETRIREHLAQLPPKLISKPLFTGLLSGKQWNALAQLHKAMTNEYQLRREMLLKRLDVTIQSFQWSGKAKNKVNEVTAVYVPRRRQMAVEPAVDLADLLSAREDLTNLEKTSSSNVRKNTSCSVNKILIGRVPDRGGRPSETRAPPPEMPSWQKRTDGPSGGRGGGRGFGGGGGGRGRVQGGWSGGRGGGRRF